MQQLILWGGLAAIIAAFFWLVIQLPVWLHNRQHNQAALYRRRNRDLVDRNAALRKTLVDTFEALQLVSAASDDDRLIIETTRDRISATLIDTHPDATTAY